MGWTDLRAPAPGDRTFVIPGSAPAVRMRLLHLDRDSGANLAVVDFPPGWSRPSGGHYLAGEEFVVLRGGIHVGDRAYPAGEWVWVPPGAHRGPSTSPQGARALAWFSGAPDWIDGAGSDEPVVHAPLRAAPGRRRRGGVPGGSEVAADVVVVADATRDLLRLCDLAWCLVRAGDPAPAVDGPCLVRTWR